MYLVPGTRAGLEILYILGAPLRAKKNSGAKKNKKEGNEKRRKREKRKERRKRVKRKERRKREKRKERRKKKPKRICTLVFCCNSGN